MKADPGGGGGDDDDGGDDDGSDDDDSDGDGEGGDGEEEYGDGIFDLLAFVDEEGGECAWIKRKYVGSERLEHSSAQVGRSPGQEWCI